MMRTLYDVVGVRPDVDDGTIRLAFRTLAKAWHPDANGGDRWSEQRFKQITAAYVTLRNPASRAAYDVSLQVARRRRRERRTRDLFYCVIVAVVTFGMVSGGAVFFHRQQATTAAASASVKFAPRGPAAPPDQPTTVSAAVDTGTQARAQRRDVAPPPPAVEDSVDPPGAFPGKVDTGFPKENATNIESRGDAAASPQSPERVEETTGNPVMNAALAGEDARQAAARAGSAMPLDTTEVRVWAGARRPPTHDSSGVRTFTVRREAVDLSADDPRNTSARGPTAEIRLWTARRGGGPAGVPPYRMRLLTVDREPPHAERSAGVGSSRTRD
jgi:curved DNA-binding protein CbpA